MSTCPSHRTSWPHWVVMDYYWRIRLSHAATTVARLASSARLSAPFDVDDEQTGGTVEEALDEAVSLGEGELEPRPYLGMQLRRNVVDGGW